MERGEPYLYHGQQDEARGGGLERATAGVDEEVDRRRREDYAGGEVADYGHVVGLDGVGGDDDKDAYYEEEDVDDRPPGEDGEFERLGDLYLADDAADEGHYPRELGRLAKSIDASVRLTMGGSPKLQPIVLRPM